MQIPRSHFNKINAILAPLGGVGAGGMVDRNNNCKCYVGAAARLAGVLPTVEELGGLENNAAWNAVVKLYSPFNPVPGDPLLDQGFDYEQNDRAMKILKGELVIQTDERVPLIDMLTAAGVTIVEDEHLDGPDNLPCCEGLAQCDPNCPGPKDA
jgi:hypothetical protein